MNKPIPHTRKIISTSVAAALLAASAAASAQETTLRPVEVRGQNNSALAVSATFGQASSFEVGAAALPTLGGVAQTSPYRAIELAPSIHVEGVDAYGITVDQNFMRVRGQMGYTFSNLAATVEGLPSTANVGQAAIGNLYDLENVERVTSLRGPLGADQGFGFGNLAGSLDMRLLRPAETAGATVHVAAGSDSFQKVFVRGDSGRFGVGGRLFVSASETVAEKWRGSGEQKRKNANFGFVQDAGPWQFELFGAYNEFDRHEYRSLSYAQTLDKANYRDYDYATNLTGNRTANVNYFGFNRQHFTEANVMATIRYQLDKDSSLVFRPYYLKTDGYRLAGIANDLGSPGVDRYKIEQEQSGFVAAWEKTWADGRFNVGYWSQRIDTIPPLPEVKVLRESVTGELSFGAWKTLADVGAREFKSPFAQVEQKYGQWDFAGGLRYFSTGVPSVTTYGTTGLADNSRDGAIVLSPSVDQLASTTDKRFDALLPNLSARYAFSNRLSARAAYARNAGYPYQGPLYSTYTGNKAAFSKAGVTLQNIWDGMKLEVADALDLGLRFNGDDWYVAPTAFYAKHHDKQVTVFDPLVGLNYQQNGGKATSKGIEIEGGWDPVKNLSLFGSLSWNRFTFDDNLRNGVNSVIAVSGKQIADTPKLSAKLGASWGAGPFSVSPLVRYIGARYGDSLETQKISGYAVADLHLSYRIQSVPGLAKDMVVSFSALNMFDKRYIGIITADERSPGSASVYYPGAPRTWTVSVKGQF